MRVKILMSLTLIELVYIYSCFRNAFLANKGFATPKTTKTGTTICGVVFEGGVVVGADTRSTSGEIVADKNCMKIHPLAPNMVRT